MYCLYQILTWFHKISIKEDISKSNKAVANVSNASTGTQIKTANANTDEKGFDTSTKDKRGKLHFTSSLIFPYLNFHPKSNAIQGKDEHVTFDAPQQKENDSDYDYS